MGFFEPELPIAIFSPDRRYRYLLRRIWRDNLPPLPIVMYNPSVGNETDNDPTITRCVGFAGNNHFGGIVIANLHAMVTKWVVEIGKASDPFGPDNDLHLRSLISLAKKHDSPILCAWGGMQVQINADIKFVRSARTHGVRTVCLGRTKQGAPRHPLFLPATARFEEFIL